VLGSSSVRASLKPGPVRRSPVRLSSVGRSMDGPMPPEDELRLEYGPFAVALGRPTPAQVRGWVARSGYGVVVRGEGEVSHTLRIASLLGLPAMKANANGVAQMDMLIAGSWATNVSGIASGFSLPEVTGTVQLHNLRATVQGVNRPIEVSSAELQLSQDEVRMEKLSAQAADAQWTGSVSLPRDCGIAGACLVHFNLKTEELGLSGLHEWLSSPPAQRRWYQMLTMAQPSPASFLQNLRASGKVSAGRLFIRDLVANRVSAGLELEHGKLKISDWRADLLGGKCRGDWLVDFATGSPRYSGSGTLTAISLQQVADAMHDPWISGIADGTYQLTASGEDSEGFWQSAEGELQFDLRGGSLFHISLASDEQPLQVVRWQGHARLREGLIEMDKGQIISPQAAYDISGSASLGAVLDFKLTQDTTEVKTVQPSALVYNITGTLAEPRVALTPAPETQAQLKP
jgi:hypothetical protein